MSTMKDKLNEAFTTFIRVNYAVFCTIGIILCICLLPLLCTCFVDMSFQPAINLYNNIMHYNSWKILRVILLIYVSMYLCMRILYVKLKNE